MHPLETDPRSFHVPAGPAAPDVPAPLPGTGDIGPPEEPGRRRRRRWPWVAGGLVVVPMVIIAVFTLMTWTMWRDVERIDVSTVTTGATSGTNYLIVGTDSRAGVAGDVENAEVIFGEDLGGERTDTMAVLHLDGDGARLLAIPRDLYVPIAGGDPSRINAAFNQGPPILITTIQQELGIGIDHYLEVDFAGFLGLVDALGGVTIDFPNPARDPKSGLDVPVAGPVDLDAAEALAYVRSRNYTEIVNGADVTDPTADLGRVQRQQRFLSAVFAELGGTWNPFTALDVVGGVKDNVVIDSDMSFVHALRLGMRLRGLDPETTTLPTRPFRTDSGAAVLLLEESEAQPLLVGFR